MKNCSTFRSRFITTASLAAAFLFFVVPAWASPTRVLAGGTTTVRLSQEFTNAVGSLNLQAAALLPARSRANELYFPITAGVLDFQNAKGEIAHSGGLRLSNQTTTVSLRNFLIDTTGTQPVLTGVVTVNNSVVGRIPLFNLTLPAIQLPISDNTFLINIPNVNVRLTSQAAAALNQAFGVNAFTANFPVGTAFVRTLTLPAFDLFRGDMEAAAAAQNIHDGVKIKSRKHDF